MLRGVADDHICRTRRQRHPRDRRPLHRAARSHPAKQLPQTDNSAARQRITGGEAVVFLDVDQALRGGQLGGLGALPVPSGLVVGTALLLPKGIGALTGALRQVSGYGSGIMGLLPDCGRVESGGPLAVRYLLEFGIHHTLVRLAA